MARTAPAPAPPLQVQIPASAAGGAGTGSSRTGSDTELANKLQNPVGDLSNVPFQNNLNFNVGPHRGTQNILNIISLGATGPFLTGLIEVIGLKRTVIGCMLMLVAAAGSSIFMTSPWQLFPTWGLLVGIGSGATAVGIAAAVTNRWFVARSGFAMGLLFAANAAGQLVFLPLLAILAERCGWQGVAVGVTLAIAAVVPILAILLPETPAQIGTRPYGARANAEPPQQQDNPFIVAIAALVRASRSMDFWLLTRERSNAQDRNHDHQQPEQPDARRAIHHLMH